MGKRKVSVAIVAEMRELWRQGHSVAAIAHTYSLSPHTVRRHCGHIIRPDADRLKLRATILALAAQGLTHRQIAQQLNLSESRVSFYHCVYGED